jgi:hypothetical protein
MKPVLLTAFLVLAQGLPPLVGPLIPDTTGMVTGIVRRAGTTQPIVEVQVALALPAESTEQAMKRAVLTDLNGRFSIKGVNAGQYVVVLQAEGYFNISSEKPPALRVNEGQQTDAGTLELVPGVAISGRIAAPDGQPLGEAIVQALRPSYTRGQLVLTPAKTVTTNDRGEYRLFWLPPGEYYVRGQYRADTPDDPERFRRVFFPGTTEEDAAFPVWINAGAEASGLDLRVPVQPVTGTTVSGRVANGGGREEVRVIWVYAIPRSRRTLVAGDHEASPNQAADAANGQFEIKNLLPGEYNLFLVTRDGEGRSRLASTPIDVADRRIENVEVTLEPQAELKGRVTLDGNKPEDRVPKGSIQLIALDEMPGLSGTTRLEIDPDPSTGEFKVPLLSPGRYALHANRFRDADIYIADATIDKESVFDKGFRMRSDSREPLEVALKSQGGVVQGVVLDPTRLRAALHSTVVLVPVQERRQNLALYKSMTTSNGYFTFQGVAPGEYKLFAWASVTPGAWENLLFVQRFESRGMAVSVAAGSHKTVDVVVIP